jgi:hypothetical protein
MEKIKEAHIRKGNPVITTITLTREEALKIQEAIEAEAMLREPLTESLTTKIKITKLMKRTVMKCRKRENPTTEVEELIKRMKLIGEVEEVLTEAIIEALIEVEGEMNKILEKLEEGTIIEEIGEVAEGATKKIRTTKSNINPIMRIINHIRIVKMKKLLRLLLVLS